MLKKYKKFMSHFTIKPLNILLIIYLSISIIIMLLFAPIALSRINSYFYEINPTYAITIFIIMLFVNGIFIFLLYNINTKEKNKQNNKNNDFSKNNMQYFGEYDIERKYIENKINELSNRLIQTEQNWLNMNHIILSSNEPSISNKNLNVFGNFLEKYGIEMNKIKIENNLVFVLTPFDNNYIDDYQIINEVCTGLKLVSKRGDETYVDSIFPHIIQLIARAKIVIANINGRNPNVFYELGIAHMMNKPTIIISRSKDELIIDLAHKYIILYNNHYELQEELKDMLLKIINIPT